MSQEPRGATAGEELYCFGMLEISLPLQCGTWIIGVLEWMQREEAGATVVQVRGQSDTGRAYTERMASRDIIKAESL